MDESEDEEDERLEDGEMEDDEWGQYFLGGLAGGVLPMRATGDLPLSNKAAILPLVVLIGFTTFSGVLLVVVDLIMPPLAIILFFFLIKFCAAALKPPSSSSQSLLSSSSITSIDSLESMERVD